MAAVVSFCLMTRDQIQVDLVVNNLIPQSPSWSTNTGQSGLYCTCSQSPDMTVLYYPLLPQNGLALYDTTL